MKRLFYIYCCAVLLLFSCGNSSRRSANREVAPKTSSQDTTPNSVNVKIKPIVNVYVENSGSMDGYVKGVTEFEQAVYSYLSDIKISKVTNNLNLFYINSEVIPQGTVSSNTDVLEDFIAKLEPSTFKKKGGNRGVSDIASVLKSILHNTTEHRISILITDGIFSPGKGKNAEEYLINQQTGIKNSFATFLEKDKNAALIVYQLSSRFDGIYYNKVDAAIPLSNAQRPYYIYIIGSANHLIDLKNAVPESRFKGSGVQHVFTITTGDKEVEYAVTPSSGRFEMSRENTQTTIVNLKKGKRTERVEFAVDVDFSALLLDDEYLLNSDSYENGSMYDLEVKPNTIIQGGTYTHTINFSSDRVYKGTAVVRLKAKRPTWVDSANDNDGSSAAKGKTYGIKYQIDGIFEAFTFEDKNKYYAEVKVDIN